MATISTNFTFDNFNPNNNLKKYDETNLNQYVLRKHLENSSTVVEKLKDVKLTTVKSEFEELQELQNEISQVEERIRNSENDKKIKIAKIEDLRFLIERIADEDRFDCVFNSRFNKDLSSNKHFENNYSSRKTSGCDSIPLLKNDSVDSYTSTKVDENAEEAGEGEGEGLKHGAICCSKYYPCCCSSYDQLRHHLQCTIEDSMQASLLFWQENILPRKENMA